MVKSASDEHMDGGPKADMQAERAATQPPDRPMDTLAPACHAFP